MAKKKRRFVKITITSGILLIIVAWLIFRFPVTPFLTETYQEIFGLGIAILALGIIFKLFNIKAG